MPKTKEERKEYNRQYYLQNIDRIKQHNTEYAIKCREALTEEEKKELYKKWREQKKLKLQKLV